jgi:transcriptional regulator with XRE-family HTH domain
MATKRLTGEDLRALREKFDLTQRQLGQLARTKIDIRASGDQASAVQKWESDTTPIPLAAQELIQAKLFLLETSVATIDDLIDLSLADILRDMYS